jgi:type III restriction enzyme
MALALKQYQIRAIDTLEIFLNRARLEGASAAFESSSTAATASVYHPLEGLPDVPYVCLRIPTGGGKTVMGARIIRVAARSFLERDLPLVLWLVPTSQIKQQTLDAFTNPRHPYRIELNDAFDGKVAVFDIADAALIRPSDLTNRVCIILGTFASARVNNPELRDLYAHKEDLEPHFLQVPDRAEGLRRRPDGEVEFSLANLLAMHRPLLIADEAHNATTTLSYEVYKRLSPAAIIELTATPDLSKSNVLVSTSAFELKAESMIKLPVVLKEHREDWSVVVSAAAARRRSLAEEATREPEYVRPLLLIQAENSRGTATVAEIKKHLIDVEGVSKNAIAVVTGSDRELDNVDLFSRDCPIEVIITKQALKEGWDCSFAYVFCSVAPIKSSKDVQQLLGRVLRMPYATPRKSAALNRAYAHVTSETFGLAASELTRSLSDIGFNPLEALLSVSAEPRQGRIPLGMPGDAVPALAFPLTLELHSAPDLTRLPEAEASRITFVAHPDGSPGGIVDVPLDVDDASFEVVLEYVSTKERRQARMDFSDRRRMTSALTAPSQQKIPFQLPLLSVQRDGVWERIDGAVLGPESATEWAEYKPDLTSFSVRDDSMTFEVDLEGRRMAYHYIHEDASAYMPGFALERSIDDLTGWLCTSIHTRFVRADTLRAWIADALESLMKERGLTLSELMRGRFMLRRKLAEQLAIARSISWQRSFDRLLDGADQPISAVPGVADTFQFSNELSGYPARFYYGGDYRFQKHFYPFVGELPWRTPAGHESEEFQFARALDTIPEIDFWVRNLAHRSQFWLPLAEQRTYPDFVAKLKDGRSLVVEYKGGDRLTNVDSFNKARVGQLWAERSEGQGLYLMASSGVHNGDVHAQIRAVIKER